MLAATTVNYGWSQALSDMAQISPVLVVSVALLVAMLLDLVLPGRVRGATGPRWPHSMRRNPWQNLW